MQGAGSASSLVVAVMESAGYLAQSNILQWFDNFWRFGGALIYMFSVVGAVVSVAIFGSYAWGRYLLIAPVLFWFLTNTTEDIDYVTWKLGGSKANNIEHVLDQVMVDRDEKLRADLKGAGAGTSTVSPDGSSTYKKTARVSWLFQKTAKISSAIVNGIVDQILYNETNDDLMLATKATVLQFFVNARPEDEQTYQMFAEVYFGSCMKYTEAQMRLVQPRYSDLRLDKIQKQMEAIASQKDNTASDALFLKTLRERYGELLKERSALKKEFDSLAEQRFKLPQSMQEFFARMGQGNRKNPLNRDITYTDQNLGSIMLSCNQMADVVAHKFIEEGKHQIGKAFTERFNQSSTSDEDLKAKRQKLCLDIAYKMHPLKSANEVAINSETGSARECDLSQTIAIFMLRQVLLQQDVSQNVIQKAKDRAEFEPTSTKYFDADKLKSGNKEEGALNEEEFKGAIFGSNGQYGRDNKGIIYVRDKSGEYRRLIRQQINSPYSTFYGPAQEYATKEIKYDIFAGATKIPYYQGVLLYLVAATFPFLALLVLVPGHAQAFLNVPLTWFWLKSWDIGYACVIVMDKILWNLLPATEIKEKIFTGTPGDPVNRLSTIPSAIQAAMATTDPTYDIHVNFNYTAMALYAVPAITGYAILKAKRSILASFTQGPRSIGKEAGSIAGSGFGLGLINRNIQRLGDQGIYATWAQGGVGDKGRGERAMMDGSEGSASMAAGADALKRGANWSSSYLDGSLNDKWKNGAGGLGNGLNNRTGLLSKTIGDAAGVYKAGSEKYRSLVGKQYMLDVAQGYAHDTDFGTASYMAKQHRVIGGMVDGARRFELEEMEFAGNIMDHKHKLFMEKFWTEQEAIISMEAAAGTLVSGSIKGLSKNEGFEEWAPRYKKITNIMGGGVAAYNLIEAMDPKSSNVEIYTDQNLVDQAGGWTKSGDTWKPFSKK